MDATQLSEIFKVKATELKNTLNPHVTPEIRLAAIFMEAMAATLLCEAFHAHVCIPYSQKINDKDSAFFLDPGNMVNGVVGDPTIIALRSTWDLLNEEEREDTWALLRQMCSISSKYAALVQK